MTNQTPPKSTDLLHAAGLDIAVQRYPGHCECGRGLDAGEGRLVRPIAHRGAGAWTLLCRRLVCTQTFLRLGPADASGGWESNDSAHEV